MRVSLQTGARAGANGAQRSMVAYAVSTVRAGVVMGALTVVATACNRSAGAAAAASDGATAAAKSPAGDTSAARLDRSRILGDSTAKVWFIMVSDFQCPYCKQFHEESFAKLRDDYVATGKVRMAYVNFPLPIHQNAWPAAEAAMCAGAQGKFWQMHDALFAGQEAWAEQHPAARAIDSLASGAGVDSVALNRCVAQHAAKRLIDADIDRGEHAGVKSTPTVLIGGTLLLGVHPIADYRRTLDSALAAAK
jgi:protein-disulfide isomerase